MDAPTKVGARYAVYIGRIFLTLALLALVGAWITQLTGAPLVGMNQQHLFNDATVFALAWNRDVFGRVVARAKALSIGN